MKTERLAEILSELQSISSPSGYTAEITEHIKKRVESLGLKTRLTNKGALLAYAGENPQAVIAGHIDTLGGMVSGINSDGTLRIAIIGGFPLPSFEGEYVTVMTGSGKKFRGTFLFDNPAAHVNNEVGKTERRLDNMHIRIDAEAFSEKDTKKLGITAGDYVFFDPRLEFVPTGYIKSRFLDDKAGAAAMLYVIEKLGAGLSGCSAAFFFSNYEEVGHGASCGFPASVREMLVVDMGVIGKNVGGKETAVSICAKDSTGPQDYEMRRRLVKLAEKNRIPYVVDIFPFYGSDAAAAIRAGYDFRAGIIGPGVSASHGVERTHIKGMKATADLVEAYIKDLGKI